MMIIYSTIFVGLIIFDLSNGLNNKCSKNEDCLASEKTICRNNICTCDTLWYYLKNVEKCVKYATEYGTICYEDIQCTEYLGLNSECNNKTNACSCLPGFEWYNGKCEKFVKKGENCTTTQKCLNKNDPLSLTCNKTTHICECNERFYEHGDDCRKISVVNEECAINKDCFPTCNIFGKPDQFSHCELGKCIADSKLTYSSRLEHLNDECKNFDNNLLRQKNFISDYAYLQELDEICISGNLIDFTQEQCEKCPKTKFFLNSTCICAPGYFLLNGKCIAELGVQDITVKYSNSSDCPIKPGKLIDTNTCFCKDYWFQSDNNRQCIKTTLELTLNCMENEWCKAMGKYAFCNKEIGKCECLHESKLDKTSFYCNLKENANLTNICLSNMDCPLYESCMNENCECMEGFSRFNGSIQCLPKIGSACEIRNCSHIKNSVCTYSNKTDEICECKNEDFVNDGYQCLKACKNLNEKCLIENQCTNVRNSACLMDSKKTTKRCLCVEDYLNVNGTCYAQKEPGSLCTTQKDCTIILGNTFVCRNMLCQCPIGKSLNKASGICTSSGKTPILSTSYYLIIIISFLISKVH